MLGPMPSTDPAPEPLTPNTARATAAEGQRDGESGGRVLGPGLGQTKLRLPFHSQWLLHQTHWWAEISAGL